MEVNNERERIQLFIDKSIVDVHNIFGPSDEALKKFGEVWSEYALQGILHGGNGPDNYYSYHIQDGKVSFVFQRALMDSGISPDGSVPNTIALSNNIALTPETMKEAGKMFVEVQAKHKISNFINDGVTQVQSMFNPSTDAMGRFVPMWTTLALQGISAGGNNGQGVYYFRSYNDGESTYDMRNALLFSGISINGKTTKPYNERGLGAHIEITPEIQAQAKNRLNEIQAQLDKKAEEATLTAENAAPAVR